jgi:quinoprotein glucose dehydrogenase
VIAFTPEIRARALELVKPFVRGPLFTPPSLDGTVQLPANGGGANWSGASFDAATGMLYVPSTTNPFLVQLAPPPDASKSNLRYRRNGQAQMPTLDGLPLVKPPYSRITAYDMNAGTIVWQTPLGDGPRAHPLLKALNLPALGGGRGYPLLTSTLLFIAHRGGQVGGPSVPREPPSLRAIDKRSGALVWKVDLDLPPSTPMTYLHQGRQYIAMATGGGARAEIVAFASGAAPSP